MDTAPVALFVFNRPEHTARTLAALASNRLADQTDLVVFSDAPRDESDERAVEEVREHVRHAAGFRSLRIVERERNLGLGESIITGVSEVLEQEQRVITLEDDLLSAAGFLCYMNAALEFYENKPAVFSVGGYTYPSRLLRIPDYYDQDVYFTPRPTSWGWASWRDRWKRVDWDVKHFDLLMSSPSMQRAFNRGGDDLTDMLRAQQSGEIDSWAIRWCFAHFLHHAVAVWPVRSFIQNIGHDSTGTHCGNTGRYTTSIDGGPRDHLFPALIFEDPELLCRFRRVFKRRLLSRIKRNLLSTGSRRLAGT